MKINKKLLLGIIIFLSLIVRLLPLNFPVLSADETRIAYRAYALSHTGKDELGRSFPLLFNALEDYQLPVVSYVTASGVLIFGKNDFGARLPFILIGVAVVFLIYKLTENFLDKKYAFYGAIIAALSPILIFFSKFPNEFIIGTFLILVLILEILKQKLSQLKIFIIILLILLTSKFLWFTLVPVLIITLFLNQNLPKREKIKITAMGFAAVLTAILIYLKVPQGVRSLVENNFSIINDVNVKNGIERMRSERVAWWPAFFDRALFNKTDLAVSGIFNWLSQLHLGRIFGEFDRNGVFGMLKTGAISKIVIVPFLAGLYLLIRENTKKTFLFLYIIIFSFPLIFLYPKEKMELIVLTLPFIVLISSYGFKFFGKKLTSFFVILLILESILGLAFIKASIKNANQNRPLFIEQIIKEAEAKKPDYNIAFSDDITEDMAPMLEWYTKFNPKDAYLDIKFPYRFKQTQLSNIKIIGHENIFYNCGPDKKTFIFASPRDLKKIQFDIRVKPIKSYKDLLGNEAVYLMPSKICVR